MHVSSASSLNIQSAAVIEPKVQQEPHFEPPVFHPRLQALVPCAFHQPEGELAHQIQVRRADLNTEQLPWPLCRQGSSISLGVISWSRQEFYLAIAEYMTRQVADEVVIEPFYSGGKAIVLACGEEKYAKACDTDIQFFVSGLAPYRIGEIEQGVAHYIRTKIASMLHISPEHVGEAWVRAYLPAPVYVVSKEAGLSIVTFKLQDNDLIFTVQAHRMHTFRGKSLLVSMLNEPLLIALEGSIEEVLQDIHLGRIETNVSDPLIGKGPLTFWELKIQGWAPSCPSLQKDTVCALAQLLSSAKGKGYLEEYLRDHRQTDPIAQLAFLLTGYLDLLESEGEVDSHRQVAQRVVCEVLKDIIMRCRHDVERSEALEAFLELAEGLLEQQLLWRAFLALAWLCPPKALQKMPEDRRALSQRKGVFINGQDLFIPIPRQEKAGDQCYLVLPHQQDKLSDLLLDPVRGLLGKMSRLVSLQVLPVMQEAATGQDWLTMLACMTGVTVPRSLCFSWTIPDTCSIKIYLEGLRHVLASLHKGPKEKEQLEAIAWNLTALEVFTATPCLSSRTYDHLLKLIGRVVLATDEDGERYLEYAAELISVFKSYEIFPLLGPWRISKGSFLKAYYLYLEGRDAMIKAHFKWLIQSMPKVEEDLLSEFFARLFDEEELFNLLWPLRPNHEIAIWHSWFSIDQMAMLGQHVLQAELMPDALQSLAAKVLTIVTPLAEHEVQGGAEFLRRLIARIGPVLFHAGVYRDLILRLSFLLDLKEREHFLCEICSIDQRNQIQSRNRRCLDEVIAIFQALGKKRPSEDLMQLSISLSQEWPEVIATLERASLGRWLSLFLYQGATDTLAHVIDLILQKGKASSLDVVHRFMICSLQMRDDRKFVAFTIWLSLGEVSKKRCLTTFLSWAEHEEVLQAPWPVLLQMMESSIPEEQKRWLIVLQRIEMLTFDELLRVSKVLWGYRKGAVLDPCFLQRLVCAIVSQNENCSVEVIRWITFCSQFHPNIQGVQAGCRHLLRIGASESQGASILLIQALSSLAKRGALSWSNWEKAEWLQVIDLWHVVSMREVFEETANLLVALGSLCAMQPSCHGLRMRCEAIGDAWLHDLANERHSKWMEKFFSIELRATFSRTDKMFFLMACIVERVQHGPVKKLDIASLRLLELFHATLDACDTLQPLHEALIAFCLQLAAVGNRGGACLSAMLREDRLHFKYLHLGYTLLCHPHLQGVLMSSLPGWVIAYFYQSYARYCPEDVDRIHETIWFYQKSKSNQDQLRELAVRWFLECALRYKRHFIQTVCGDDKEVFSNSKSFVDEKLWESKKQNPEVIYSLALGWLSMAQQVRLSPMSQGTATQVLRLLYDFSHVTGMLISHERMLKEDLSWKVVEYTTELAALSATLLASFPHESISLFENMSGKREVMLADVIMWLLSLKDRYYVIWSLSLLVSGAIDLFSLPKHKGDTIAHHLIDTFYFQVPAKPLEVLVSESLYFMTSFQAMYDKSPLSIKACTDFFIPHSREVFRAIGLHIDWSATSRIQAQDLRAIDHMLSIALLQADNTAMESCIERMEVLIDKALSWVPNNPSQWGMAACILKKGCHYLYLLIEDADRRERLRVLLVKVGAFTEGAIEKYLKQEEWYQSEAFLRACSAWTGACAIFVMHSGKEALCKPLMTIFLQACFGLEKIIDQSKWEIILSCQVLISKSLPYISEEEFAYIFPVVKKVFSNFERVVSESIADMGKVIANNFINKTVLPSYQEVVIEYLEVIYKLGPKAVEAAGVLALYHKDLKRLLDKKSANLWSNRLQTIVNSRSSKVGKSKSIVTFST